MAFVLLLASFAVILVGALVFTNAVEWLGHRLAMGMGAVGSLLAAVGTAMPETLIPIVAIIGAAEGSEDVAIGAIVGAPFLLATIAMAIVGLTAVLYVWRRPQGRGLDAHLPTLERDLIFFLAFFAVALALGQGAPTWLQIVAAVLCFTGYAYYVRRTLTHGGAIQIGETLDPLLMTRGMGAFAGPEVRSGRGIGGPEPGAGLIALQMLIGLGAMIAGAHLFVHELLSVAEMLGASPLVLALIFAPLATELPEKANSFFWVREGKDSLALGNITGAMVFQSTIPVGIGLAFTSWELDGYANASIILGLAGGIVAYLALRRGRRFSTASILAWAGLYLAFLAYVLL